MRRKNGDEINMAPRARRELSVVVMQRVCAKRRTHFFRGGPPTFREEFVLLGSSGAANDETPPNFVKCEAVGGDIDLSKPPDEMRAHFTRCPNRPVNLPKVNPLDRRRRNWKVKPSRPQGVECCAAGSAEPYSRRAGCGRILRSARCGCGQRPPATTRGAGYHLHLTIGRSSLEAALNRMRARE
jgi:hypothetical protein